MLHTVPEKIIYVVTLTAIFSMVIWKSCEGLDFHKETRNFWTIAVIEAMAVLLFIGLFGDKVNEIYARIFH